MLCEEETMSETTMEYNTLTARQDNLLSPLQPEAGITSQYLSFFLLKWDLRWLMLADSCESCFEKRLTPKRRIRAFLEMEL